MKRSALLLANALIVTCYAVAVMIYMLSGAGVAQGGDPWNGLFNAITNLLLAGHMIYLTIGLLLLWIAYVANSFGSALASGILFLIAAYVGGTIIPQASGVVFAALSFFGTYSVKQARQRNEAKVRRMLEREHLQREQEIEERAIRRYEQAKGITPDQAKGSAQIQHKEHENDQMDVENLPETRKKGPSNGAMYAIATVCVLAGAAALILWGPALYHAFFAWLDSIIVLVNS